MASNKPNKLAFLSYVAGLGRGALGFTTRSDIGPAREGPSAETIAEAQALRGEDPEIDPEQFQDPDNEYGPFAGTTYEQDDEEADRVYEGIDHARDSRRRLRREAQEQAEMSKLRAEKPKIQQPFADLKRKLSTVTMKNGSTYQKSEVPSTSRFEWQEVSATHHAGRSFWKIFKNGPTQMETDLPTFYLYYFSGPRRPRTTCNHLSRSRSALTITVRLEEIWAMTR